jgi:hypothetical protein
MENRTTSLFLKETIAELTGAEKCREYTIERLREIPRKTNRRDFRRANVDRFISAKSVVTTKKKLQYGGRGSGADARARTDPNALKVTAVDSPTNPARERHWAMIRTPGNPARDEHQSRARTYLALNWQRRKIKTKFTWIEQRFPTPPQRRNSRQTAALVTTGALLPISQPISTFLGRKARREPKGGGGGSRVEPPKASYR